MAQEPTEKPLLDTDLPSQIPLCVLLSLAFLFTVCLITELSAPKEKTKTKLGAFGTAVQLACSFSCALR